MHSAPIQKSKKCPQTSAYTATAAVLHAAAACVVKPGKKGDLARHRAFGAQGGHTVRGPPPLSGTAPVASQPDTQRGCALQHPKPALLCVHMFWGERASLRMGGTRSNTFYCLPPLRRFEPRRAPATLSPYRAQTLAQMAAGDTSRPRNVRGRAKKWCARKRKSEKRGKFHFVYDDDVSAVTLE